MSPARLGAISYLRVFPQASFFNYNNVGDTHAYIESEIFNINKLLPMYMQIIDVVIRKNEFVKTSMNKIKRQDN